MASLLLVLVLSVPRIGGHTHLWANGLYDALVVILIFPAIVFLGAISKVSSDLTQKLAPSWVIYPILYTSFTSPLPMCVLCMGEQQQSQSLRRVRCWHIGDGVYDFTFLAIFEVV